MGVRARSPVRRGPPPPPTPAAASATGNSPRIACACYLRCAAQITQGRRRNRPLARKTDGPDLSAGRGRRPGRIAPIWMDRKQPSMPPVFLGGHQWQGRRRHHRSSDVPGFSAPGFALPSGGRHGGVQLRVARVG